MIVVFHRRQTTATNQSPRNDDEERGNAPQRHKKQQHGLLMHMPSPQKARHSAQHDRIQESFIRRIEPEFREIDEEERSSERKGVRGSDVGEDAECRFADQATRGRGDCGGGDFDSATEQICYTNVSNHVLPY